MEVLIKQICQRCGWIFKIVKSNRTKRQFCSRCGSHDMKCYWKKVRGC